MHKLVELYQPVFLSLEFHLSRRHHSLLLRELHATAREAGPHLGAAAVGLAARSERELGESSNAQKLTNRLFRATGLRPEKSVSFSRYPRF